MCLPETLNRRCDHKGRHVKLWVIAAVTCHSCSVNCQVHVMGCDVMISSRVIGLLMTDVADRSTTAWIFLTKDEWEYMWWQRTKTTLTSQRITYEDNKLKKRLSVLFWRNFACSVFW